MNHCEFLKLSIDEEILYKKLMEDEQSNIIYYKNRKLDHNKPVKVYRNLHQEKLSIKQDGKVIAHCDYINLKNVTFHVQKSGLEKCRKEKRKNVHAYVKGYYCNEKIKMNDKIEIEYNPYKYDNFVDEFKVKIEKLSNIYIDKFGIMIGNL